MRSFLRRVIMGVSFRSLGDTKLGAEGGKAVAEALKVNTSITNIR